MAANNREVLDFHARSSAVLANLLYENILSLEEQFLRLGLEPLAPTSVLIEAVPEGADRNSFLSAMRRFDVEYFSFLAACAWCIWICGLARCFPPIEETCRKVLDCCKNEKEWIRNIKVRSLVGKLRAPEAASLSEAVHEHLNYYLVLLLKPDWSRFPLTKERVDQTFAKNDAQRMIWLFFLNVYSDALVATFSDATGRDSLTSYMWALLESQTEKVRLAGKSYDAQLPSVVAKALHLAAEGVDFNERNRK